ncbi:N-acetyl-gamma-glutamyl-phosphate reductase [Marinivivus vitaminiproducens]|uniref:N-acetyl-gamma-glutamyl-phosphate reductase n=1 Tax=Marinivivus vitaminiproducens TaxID=3035935 RepID=UPI0027A1822D|nr:N-acetyl-gamma-glutamyl-phosphate reductase [Geminicoccaceae bacterium SCSIO 64248]
MAADQVKVAIMGASGYTGAELVRLLASHPRVRIEALTADRHAGKPLSAVFPHLAGQVLPDLTRIEDLDADAVDAVFLCLPHGTTQEVALALPPSVRIVDLSADFRLRDTGLYAETYGKPHAAPDLQAKAVYGLTEFARDGLASADLVACPGCYPTSAQLPLRPLLEAGLINPASIIVDAKSGVSGAGRAAKESSLFTEVAEGFHAYGVANHRHAPEIEQGLADSAGQPMRITFTPHLVPMNRGILATVYVGLNDGVDAQSLHDVLAVRYRDEPFVQVLPMRSLPSTRHVRGSNACHIAVHADRVPGRAILLCAIDNLVKGASGQALQNLNVMFGLDERLGLAAPAIFP